MDICSTEWTWTTVQVLAIASASENDKLSTTESTENVRCCIVKMLYTKKKYNKYCLDVVTSISVMIRMIKTTLFFFFCSMFDMWRKIILLPPVQSVRQYKAVNSADGHSCFILRVYISFHKAATCFDLIISLPAL
jgi:hypothetical protein